MVLIPYGLARNYSIHEYDVCKYYVVLSRYNFDTDERMHIHHAVDPARIIFRTNYRTGLELADSHEYAEFLCFS